MDYAEIVEILAGCQTQSAIREFQAALCAGPNAALRKAQLGYALGEFEPLSRAWLAHELGFDHPLQPERREYSGNELLAQGVAAASGEADCAIRERGFDPDQVREAMMEAAALRWSGAMEFAPRRVVAAVENPSETLPLDIIPGCEDPDCDRYHRWEGQVAVPALEAAGFRVLNWYTGDGDSFGPLTRVVRCERDGKRYEFMYG